jgi:elongator complex protein 4
LYLLPTGIPSLDDLLGGGLPLGGILGILAPDHHTAWSRLTERYFVAQALVTGQRSVVVGEPGESRDVVAGCMWVDERTTTDGSESEGEGVGGSVGEGKGGMRIAWRYERMKKFQTTIKGES